jgi:hypothetical protein
MKIVTTAAIGAACLAGAAWAADPAAPAWESDARDALARLVETRRLIAQEKQEWRLGREVLQDRVKVLEREVASVQEKIAQATNETADVDAKLAETRAQQEQAAAAADAMRKDVVALEGRARALLARAPDPVKERLKPLSQRLPDNSADTKISQPERFQNAIGILNELGKANGEIVRAMEFRDLDGKPTQVEAVYVGLAQAYYVSAKGDAGVGRPGANGWEWKRANDLAARVTEIIQILQNKASARFVPLPVTVP